jgi:hypothetical protein
VGLAFGSLGFSIAIGVCLTTVVSLTVRTLQASRPAPTQIDLGGGPALTLLFGTFAACLAAAVATWRLMSRARSPYRQGMLAMVSFFGSFLLSMIAWPVDRAFGRTGLVCLAIAAAGLAVLAGRKVARELRGL